MQGPDALYLVHGEALAAEVREAGGIMTAQDLLSAQPLVKDAISIQARGAHPPASCMHSACAGRARQATCAQYP